MLEKILSQILRKIADDLDSNKYSCSEDQLITLIDEISSFNTDMPLSKDQSCLFLNISRSTFDGLIRDGKLPKGQKHRGLKELTWKKSVLIAFKNKN